MWFLCPVGFLQIPILRVCSSGIIREQLTQLSGLVEQILTLSVENRNTFRLKQESIPITDIIPPLIEQHKLKAVPFV